MNTRRTVIVAGLALVLSAVAGCHSAGSTTSSPSSGSVKDSLLGSIAAMGRTSYAIELTADHLNASGSVDPTQDVASLTAEETHGGQTVRVQALSIAADSWAKLDLGSQTRTLGIEPGKWLHLDPEKVSGAGSLPFDQADKGDAFDLRNVLDGVISVSRIDAQHFRGTIDLTGVHGVASLVPAGSRLGAAAASVPFTATLDGQGRLTDLRVGTEGQVWSFDFDISDYSAAVPPQAPNDVDVVRAPSGVYRYLRAQQLATT